MFAGMTITYASGIYVVAATKDGKTEYWAAATPRDDAVATIGCRLGPEWLMVLTDKKLTTDAVAELGLRSYGIRKLAHAP